MLAHSPPLPLIIDHLDQHNDIMAADEQGIILALRHRDRVRRIRLMKSVPILQKLITALDGEFPILEYLSIIHQRYRRPSIEHNMHLNLPETFRAPHLRHIVLMSFAIPIGFGFHGASAYLEALLPWVTMPLIERLQVSFFNQLPYSIPHLQQFMGTAENLRLNTATLTFLLDHLTVVAYPYKGARMFTLVVAICGRHLDWQVASTAQVLQTLKTVFSTVEHLTLEYKRHLISSEWSNEADRAQWRELFGTFDNVKTLLVDDELVEQISHTLQPGDGESPTDLLPELQELSHPARSPENAFIPFVNARQRTDRPVTVIHPSAE